MTQTMVFEYNPLNVVARHIVELLKVSKDITIVNNNSPSKTKEGEFTRKFTKAMKNAKAYKEGELEFRNVNCLLDEL